MNLFLFSFFFFLPAGVANMVPVFAAKIPLLKDYCYPLDFGLNFRGKRILGDHKTIRGLIFGILLGTIFAMLEQRVIPSIFLGTNPVLLGFLLSFGALLGDSVKSFFKRQINIPSGKSWFPFDQIDYIVGGLLLSLVVIRLPMQIYITIFILYFLLHLVISYIGYLTGYKKVPI